MPKRDQDYNLIDALHDLLEDIDSYERSSKAAADCEECARVWSTLKARAEESVGMIRQEIQNHVGT